MSLKDAIEEMQRMREEGVAQRAADDRARALVRAVFRVYRAGSMAAGGNGDLDEEAATADALRVFAGAIEDDLGSDAESVFALLRGSGSLEAR